MGCAADISRPAQKGSSHGGRSHTSAVTWRLDELAVIGAASIEAIGCFLFIRALLRYRGGRIGRVEVYQALTWNIAVWFAFIVGTEFFIAYPSESPFREMLGLGLLMTLIVTVVPDRVDFDDQAAG